jgi:hypothetical protein
LYPNFELFRDEVQRRLEHLGFEEKQLALEMLGITVWLNGQEVEIIGKIDSVL